MHPLLAMKKVYFFTIVLEQHLKHKKLMIPSGFVTKYGEQLSGRAILRVPAAGASWQVELVKNGGSIWLKGGWPQFAEAFSIRQDHLLLFKYEGRSHFSVVIFDRTATDMNNPQKGSIDLDGENANSPKPERKATSQLPSSPPSKRMKRHTRFRSSPKQGCKSDGPSSSKQKRKQPSKGEGCANVTQRARAFRPKNSFFKINVTPAIIHQDKSYKLNVPTWFSKLFLKNHVGGDVILEVAGGRACRVCCVSAGGERVKLSGGWKLFWQQNHLQVGDICYFEWIEGQQVKLLVTILRDSGVE